jgi:hypothetical protein
MASTPAAELVRYRCPKCGHETRQPAAAVSVGHGCPKTRRRAYVELRRVEEAT